ncbi:hypothetical protein [Solicola sp. PLA-1-18]|uniref:arsenate reductase/protein-tyrosine-phosphatase family protein n=1 Tax=Solicola sp. PLA-1-18 TaxID=3380532 RepID=UPI003B7EBE26
MHVLTVCSGNICRSPAFETLLRSGPLADSGITVESAGTIAGEGQPVHPEIAAILADRGVDVAEFASRRLTAPMLRSADLVVTMEREHRATVVQLSPSHVRRTFTLRELERVMDRFASADTLGTTVDERWSQLLQFGSSLRTPPERPEDDDIADPINGQRRDFQQAVDEIVEGITAIERVILDAPPEVRTPVKDRRL